MLDVVGVGTNSVDEVLQLPVSFEAVPPGGKVRIGDRQFLCGGQTATVMAACAALGLRPGYVGAFGSDEHGQLIRDTLAQFDVDIRGSIECDAPNRGAVILVDPKGNRTVLWHRSGGLKVPFGHLETLTMRARIVHVDDDDPDLALHAADAARLHNVRVTSDLEHPSDSVERLIAAVTYPVFEQNLPTTLTGERDPERALRKLRRLNGGLLVMTRGAEGSVALDGDEFHTAPAFAVNVVDGTGAGDVFRAGFIYGLLQKCAVPELLRFANATAAVSCTRLGAIPSVPKLSEVREFLASRY